MDWTDRLGRRLKLRDLHILLTVTKSGSMGQAARDLAVSQPVVSKAISQLEDLLGAQLFDRSAQGVVPTVYGAEMIQRGRAVFDELQQGVKALDFLRDPTSGDLHIGCTEFGAIGLVPLVIERLGQRFPGLNVHVLTADPVALTTIALPHRTVELAVSAIPEHVPTNIAVEQLFEERHVIMGGIHSTWARKRKLVLSDLLNAMWVLPPKDGPARLLVDNAFRAQGLAPPVARVSTASVPLCHQLLASGQYLAILPREAVILAKHLPIKPLNVELVAIKRSIGIMTLKQRALSPIGRLFVEAARLSAGVVTHSRQ